ncbi:metallophosphoesterase [candidate division KSB1 bacterium]|nr:metallophosphoesterase [candidate division KSB1 bacterium]
MNRNLLRHVSFILLLTAIVLASLTACSNKNGESFRFVFMTDIHVQPELKADQGFQAAIEKVNELQPDFVITGGDLIMDALGQPYERAESLYALYRNLIQDFDMPVYQTLGNHEVFGLYRESGIDPQHPSFGKSMFNEQLDQENTYYAFDHKGWHFMILDGIGYTPERQYIGVVDSLQMEWIRTDLSRVDQNTPIAISTHIPFVSVMEQINNGGTAALSASAVVANSDRVIELFQSHNLKLVLQGHLHVVEEIVYKDVHYITGGAVSGRWWRGPRDGFDEGFVVVDIDGMAFDWHYQTYGWQAQNPEP